VWENCGYLRRGQTAALLFSHRITQLSCPKLSENLLAVGLSGRNVKHFIHVAVGGGCYVHRTAEGTVCDGLLAAIINPIATNQGINLILPDSKWMHYSQQDQTLGGHLACRAISD
jgi:hypothetical protein